jgi:hypothetical protein
LARTTKLEEKRKKEKNMATKKTTAKKTTKKKAPPKKKAAKQTSKATKKKAPKKAAKSSSKVAAPKKEASKAKAKPAKKEAAKVKKPAARKKRSKTCEEDGCRDTVFEERYCRAHYIRNWQTIIEERKHKARKNLNKYIESMSEKFPNQFMDKIRDDLSDEKNFHSRLRQLGFKEEYETSGDNPFSSGNFQDLVKAFKAEE